MRTAARVRACIDAGQWQVVGGWYVQPDCNFPTAESIRMHMQVGRDYCLDKLGTSVTVGYNVDSFGHSAMLPSFLRETGYDSYVMMRPMQHEKRLPSALFRWRAPNGAEVLTWRIPRSYATRTDDLADQVRAALAAADVGHVMCFYGVGDHGGGPTEQQIQWIHEHRDAFPGARLVFSHPRRFFDAVLASGASLPVVCDELQYHAVGCYSVVRDIKQHMRRAEHRLAMAACALSQDSQRSSQQLMPAWKAVLFNQFHDILAGTSIPEAYRDARDQLGQACSISDQIIYGTIFRKLRSLPADQSQRIVVFNMSEYPFSGCITHEPWLSNTPFGLIDESNQSIPYQFVQQPSVKGGQDMLAWQAELPAQSMIVYRLKPAEPTEQSGFKTDLVGEKGRISNSHWTIEAGLQQSLLRVSAAGKRVGEPLFAAEGLCATVFEDRSDTWSHGIPAYGGPLAGGFRVLRSVVEETGPVRAALRIEAEYDRSTLVLRAMLYAQSASIELQLWLTWHQRLQLLKLSVPFAWSALRRVDGIPGGYLQRPQNGHEFPVSDWTLASSSEAARPPVGIVCPDCWSLSGSSSTLAFTLCRSPVYAWHDPAVLNPDDFYHYTDQGEHHFRFRFLEDVGPEALKCSALSLRRTPICLDWTNGMGAEN